MPRLISEAFGFSVDVLPQISPKTKKPALEFNRKMKPWQGVFDSSSGIDGRIGRY